MDKSLVVNFINGDKLKHSVKRCRKNKLFHDLPFICDAIGC